MPEGVVNRLCFIFWAFFLDGTHAFVDVVYGLYSNAVRCLFENDILSGTAHEDSHARVKSIRCHAPKSESHNISLKLNVIRVRLLLRSSI